VVEDVKAFLTERIEFALACGVLEERIWVDPGIGFGKTLEHNLELLRRLDELRALGRPICVGTSRKSFIGKITRREVTDRLGGTIASNVLALMRGAEIFRVHDVRAVREALQVAEAILARRDRAPA
jgi:dihydropteroate synthase